MLIKLEKKINIIIFILITLTLNIMHVITIKDYPFNIAISDLFVPIALVLLLIALWHYTFPEIFPVYYCIIALIGWITLTSYLAIISVTIVDDGWLGYASELIKTLICISYLYVGYNILKHIKKETLLRLLTVGAIIFLAVGFLASFLVVRGLFPDILRINHRLNFLGTYSDPNHATTYITLSFYIMLFGLKYDDNKCFKGLYSLVSLLLLVSLFLTNSRGGLLGFIGGIVVFSLLLIAKDIRKLISVTLISGIVITSTFIVDTLLTEGALIGRLFNSFTIGFSRGMDIRMGLTRVAFRMGMDHPIFGVGRGNYILNSAEYFDKMGIEVLNNIPHNTYFGLFAEVGFIGTLLYFIPVFLMIYYSIKRFIEDREWFLRNRFFFYLLMATNIAIGIQAFVLNVENRRTLWFMAGVIIYCLKYKHIDIDESVTQKIKGRMIKLNSILLIVLLLIGSYSIAHSYILRIREEVIDDYSIRIPVREEDLGKELTIEYHINTRQTGFEGIGVRYLLVEVDNEDSERILDTYDYPQTFGYAKRTFIKENPDTKIYLRFEKISKKLKRYHVWPIRVYNDREEYILKRNYVLSPDFMDEKLSSARWKEREEDEYITYIGEELAITFGEKLILKRIDTFSKEDKKYFALEFICLESLDKDYILWCFGVPDNIHNLDPKRLAANSEHYPPLEAVKTSTWIPGETYTVTYEFPRTIGWYHIRCGFYAKIDDEVIRLYIDKDKRLHVADLGWINAELD